MEGAIRNSIWEYRSIIGLLNYISGSSRPDIAYATHSAARFSANPKASHDKGVKSIIKYLKGTKENRLIMYPRNDKGLEFFVDADFAGGWSTNESENPDSVYSRTGYMIKYKNCLILSASKLQSEIFLSTTEPEYIALSQALREIIPMMEHLEQLEKMLNIESKRTSLKCKLFKDNNSAIELAKDPKIRPCTKHIALKYHHFREHVRIGLIEINPISTLEQVADIFTKAFPFPIFNYMREKMMGWNKQ